MNKNTQTHFETTLIHCAQEPDQSTGSVIPPIYQTSTYAQSSPGVHKGFEYSRTDNPTRRRLEMALAASEHGRDGLCFASGMAAITSFIHTLSPGDHVLCSNDLYGGTYRLFTKVMAGFGLEFDFVDFSQGGEWESACRENTRLIWLETPSNPMLSLIDIERVSVFAQRKKLRLLVDNTFASPYLQNPLLLGADVVLHSTTKYIGGHSDVVGGAIICQDQELLEKLRFVQNSMGAIPGPFDCWLTHRSLKTLSLRMQKHCENAMSIAQFLEKHPKVESVIYPGLASHSQHELAKRQMKDFGGMISVVLGADLESTKTFLSSLQIFTLAESLGGIESLIEHPAIMTHASIPKKERDHLGISDGLVRLSVGIEHVEDLQYDLSQALDRI
ncbi:MAG: cystathionine gamma-synthase [Bdellovibrionales bacterium]|nr:cystathionine gamma-synthase [Bdellovibrionales bacterium]